MKRAIAIVLISITLYTVLGVTGFSQNLSKEQKDQNFLGLSPKSPSFSLLDPSRLKMTQSYTISYFSSKSDRGSLGLYTNTIQYQLSKPLTVWVGLSYLHQPLNWLKSQNISTQGRILPNFMLEYKPNSNFYFLVKFSTLPYGLYDREDFWEPRR
jgi:hypothetical protein